ncbi:MAG: ABC transporter permease [Sporomusaceae bacterium]|nr:ABC transporter permease [Sporomusaceae bacterium]
MLFPFAVKLEKRLEASLALTLATPLISVFLALLFCAVFLAATGQDPVEVYTAMAVGAAGSAYGLSETVVKAIPLMLCGLGISIAFRMQLWNIGGEGQFYVGAALATWAALQFSGWPAWLLLPLMLALGMLGGGVWALIAAVLRARWQVNEIIITLMLNYIGSLWVSYLVHGPWRDPNGHNFPLTAPFSPAALLPTLGDSRIHAGLLLAVVLIVILHVVFRQSRWGYEIRVIGANETAARYAGMNINRNIYLVMLASGALCGLAGMAEVSGIVGRLQAGISPGYGFTAIIVAYLSRMNPLAIGVVSLLFGGLQVGGYYIQTFGVSATVSAMLQGAILFFVAGGEVFTRYRLVIRRQKGVAADV